MEMTDYQKGLALYILQAENRGEAIRDLRKINNMTQGELSRRLGCKSPSTIADIEGGRRNNMTVDSLVKYAVALSENGNGKKKSDFGIYPLDRRMKRH